MGDTNKGQQILRVLEGEGAQTAKYLAETVGLKAPSVRARIQKLRRQGHNIVSAYDSWTSEWFYSLKATV